MIPFTLSELHLSLVGLMLMMLFQNFIWISVNRIRLFCKLDVEVGYQVNIISAL